MIDKYGREIIDNGNNTYSVPGIIVRAIDVNAALITFDGMAPEGWEEVEELEPLDKVGALATLLAVVGILTVEDAANAVQLTPEDLIAEAEAWAVASGSLS